MVARRNSDWRHPGTLSFLTASVLALALFLAVLVLLAPGQDPKAAAQDCIAGPHSGALTTSQEWCLVDSPHLVTGDVTVNHGVILTIEPGVVVKFQTVWEDLIVEGTLLAQGTEASPIAFTSYKDDDHGGDTNGDGDATNPGPGDWGGIIFEASSNSSVLEQAWVGYGGYGGVPYRYANVHLFTSDVRLQNNTIVWSPQQGIHVGGVDPAQPLLLTGNTFLNNAQWAIYDDATGALADITLVDNTSSGSAHNGYGIVGSIEGTVTYSSTTGFPFIVWNDVTVQAGSALTLGPGTVVKFNDIGDDLIVDGRLTARGTKAQPIVFTSFKDDEHGSDTNGDGGITSPAPGDWGGISFTASSNGSVLERVWIGYGGYGGSPYGYANVHLFTSDVRLQNNTIAWSNVHGLHVGGVDPAFPLGLTANTFLTNTQWAIYDDAAGTLTDITLVDNTSSGSAHNGYGIVGSIEGTVTYSSTTGFPFIVWNDVTVQAGSALTLGPGTVVKFNDIGDDLIVDGRLTARGTEAQPIVFTSFKDDEHGGDTNGDGSATSPTPGDWGGIWVAGEAGLGNTQLRYTGYARCPALRVESGAEVDFAAGLVQDSKSHAMAVSGTGRLLLSDSRIEHNEGAAVFVEGDEAWVHVSGSSLVGNGVVGDPAGGVHNTGNATVVLGGEPGAGNTITANAGYGAYQEGTSATMLATYNWWGDSSGPYHPAFNPGGLGEEVSDRVVFTPWLSETNALPSEGLVELLAPLSFSPGETFNLGVRFANVLTETLENVVLVAALPPSTEFVLSTGGGVYRPGDHDVVWRLGDVAPGESLDALARIEMAWGLPEHTWFGARALVAATNLPNPAVDLDEVLSYTPVTTLTQHYLTPGEIAAELAADPELEALLQEAQALGFTFYDTALKETYNIGGELLTMVLLDRERMDQIVYVRRDGDEHTIQHTTPAYATEYNDAGGWRYDLGTGEWSFWGSWAPTAVGGSLTEAQPEEEPTDPCDPAYPKTIDQCRRNVLIALLGGILDQYHRDAVKDKQADSCLICQRAGMFCDDCAKKILSGCDRGKRASVKWGFLLCDDNQHRWDCHDDFTGCHQDTKSGRWYVRKELCDLLTCDFSGWTDYERCEDGAKCVRGCCEGVSSTPGASVCSLQQERDRCECPPDICSDRALENRTAADPNAKLGPAEAGAGEWISYTVQYENVGAGTAYGVYVVDQLSPLLDDSTLELHDGGLYFPSSRTVYWPVGELAPGAGGSLDFRVQVPTDAVSGTVIVNSATVYFPSVPETTPTGDVVTLVQDLVAHSQRVETVEGVPLAITLTGHSAAGPLTYQIVAGPGGGELSGTPPAVVYMPDPGFEGPDAFTFRVNDGLEASEPARVSIVVHTGAETVPPEVWATSPSPDETGVQVSTTPVFSDTYAPSVAVFFTEPIDPETVTTENLFVADGAGRHLTGYTVYDAGAYAARFVPQEPFQKGSTYTARATTGVHDTSGNGLAADYVWSFTTQTGPAGGNIYLPLVLRQH